MPNPTEVVTLEDIVNTTSEMRLTLKKKPESLTDQKLSDSKESDPKDEDLNSHSNPTEVVTLDVVGATSEIRLTQAKKPESLTDQKLSDSKESDPKDEDLNSHTNPTEVVTLEDIVGATSEMRLTLKKKSESLTDPKLIGSKEKNSEKLAREFVKSLMEETRAELEEVKKDTENLHVLDEKAEQELKEANIEKIKAITEKTVQKLRTVEKVVIDEMVKLPTHVQPQVITFWESAQTFFGGVMEWLSNMFKYVMDKIRQGCRLVKNAITGLFDTVCRFLGNIFKSNEQIEKERRDEERRDEERRDKERRDKERRDKERRDKERRDKERRDKERRDKELVPLLLHY